MDDKSKQALFGISLDSAEFTSERFSRAIAALKSYDKITFFIADGIQLYNDLAKLAADRSMLASSDWTKTRADALAQRKRWLTKMRQNLRNWPTDQLWKIIGIRDIADPSTWDIARRVRLLYLFDEHFHRDVKQQAVEFSSARDFGVTKRLLEELSVEYLLEEVALNIRIRVVGRIHDEFYLGRFPNFLRRLYAGRYLKSAGELAGVSDPDVAKYCLFDWVDDSRWEVPTDGGRPPVAGPAVTME
jgi:hypothetical protein